jgi:hypothetical protein
MVVAATVMAVTLCRFIGLPAAINERLSLHSLRFFTS